MQQNRSLLAGPGTEATGIARAHSSIGSDGHYIDGLEESGHDSRPFVKRWGLHDHHAIEADTEL